MKRTLKLRSGLLLIHYLNRRCEDGVLREEIVVATTRPETMLGDTKVAVHPEDPRYKALIGKTVRHPFVDEVTIVADAELVDLSLEPEV